jgi:hypothetical protein
MRRGVAVFEHSKGTSIPASRTKFAGSAKKTGLGKPN